MESKKITQVSAAVENTKNNIGALFKILILQRGEGRERHTHKLV